MMGKTKANSISDCPRWLDLTMEKHRWAGFNRARQTAASLMSAVRNPEDGCRWSILVVISVAFERDSPWGGEGAMRRFRRPRSSQKNS